MFGYKGACSDGGYWDNGGAQEQLNTLLFVWDEYQKAFGNNLPMVRCRTDFKEWDINFEGVAHYGLIPDFLQDLHNVGLQARDMSPLFRSANDFAQMWTKSVAASAAFGPPQVYHFAQDGHGNLMLSFTLGDGAGFQLQQSSDLRNPTAWMPAAYSVVSTNPVTATIAVTMCANCSVFYRLVSSAQ